MKIQFQGRGMETRKGSGRKGEGSLGQQGLPLTTAP